MERVVAFDGRRRRDDLTRRPSWVSRSGNAIEPTIPPASRAAKRARLVPVARRVSYLRCDLASATRHGKRTVRMGTGTVRRKAGTPAKNALIVPERRCRSPRLPRPHLRRRDASVNRLDLPILSVRWRGHVVPRTSLSPGHRRKNCGNHRLTRIRNSPYGTALLCV